MNRAFAPWQQRLFDRLLATHAAGRLPHALLLGGPDRLGKRAVAERLGAAILCLQPRGDGGCGACSSCRMYDARFQRDPAETRPDERPAHPDGHPGHPDARFVGYVLNEKASPKKMYSELVIEQIRELSAWLALSPTHAAKFALIEPAHGLTVAAANALLKTLEEPIPGRYLVLASDQPHRLPATIRSRCQRIEVPVPPRDEARAWLLATGATAAQADAALDANEGHPGLARLDLDEGGLALRDEVAGDLVALAVGRERVVAAAQRWQDERLGRRLRYAVEAVREWLAGRASGRIEGRLVRAGMPAQANAAAIAAWAATADRTRDLLRTTLRTDLLAAELLREWRQACTQGVKIFAGDRARGG